MNKKGFTLIEIIVSVAIIGIIIIGGFSIIGNNFTFLRKSRDMSVDTLLTQQDIELEISDIKKQLKDSEHGLTLTDITIDGVDIGYYSVSKLYKGVNYNFGVTPEQLPEYVLLKTFGVGATLKSNTIDAYSAYPISSSSALGSNTPDTSTYSTHWMLDINQWYVSKPGYNVPVPKGPINADDFKYYDYLIANGLESELGTRYPSFPEDYILLGNETTKILSNLNNFGGRHLIYKVTAAAKSGRLGIPEFSDPIFVNSLKRVANLVVHLDASMIDPSYKDSSNNTHVDSNYKITKWLDLSSGIGASIPTQFGSPTNTLSRPLLVDSDTDTEFIGRYARFESEKMINLNNQGTNGKWLYAFAVAKAVEEEDDNRLVFSNDSNILKMDPIEARKLDDNWKFINKEYQSNSNDFQIGNDKIDIAEVIIYAFDSPLSSTDYDDLSNDVYAMVENKYLPLDTTGEIDQFLPATDKIYAGTPYKTPNFAKALMKNGTNKYVPVLWEGGVVDTSTAGVVTINGYATANRFKTVTLTLEIVNRPVESVVIDPNTIEIDINSGSLQIGVTVLPENATDKSLTWTSSDSNIVEVADGIVTPKRLGTAVVTATSNDNPSKKDSVTITVVDAATVAAEGATAKVEKSLLQADYNEAKTLVEALANSPVKTDLQARLVLVKNIMDARDALQSVSLTVSGATNINPYIALTNGYEWTSSANTTNLRIDTNQNIATAYRPGSGTATATLTATRAVNGKTLTKKFVVSIPAKKFFSYPAVSVDNTATVLVSP